MRPVEYWHNNKLLLRLPFFWEDDLECLRPTPTWQLEHLIKTGKGMKIINLHPIHIYLNTVHLEHYTTIKTTVHFTDALDADLLPFVRVGHGPRMLLEQIVAYQKKHCGGKCIRDIDYSMA